MRGTVRRRVCYILARGASILGAFSHPIHNLRGRKFGDGLGAFRHGVLGELTGEGKAHGGLNFPGGKGGTSGVAGAASGFAGEALEQVVDEGVHHAHAALGDTGVGVHLLEHLVDVGAVGFDALLAAFAAAAASLLALSALGWCLGHFICWG